MNAPDGFWRRLSQSGLARDYGMVMVLLLLCGLFSVLTLRQQHPTGVAAGRQLAAHILEQQAAPRVLVVGRDTAEHRDFCQAVAEHIRAGGGRIVAVVNGQPSDVRRAVAPLLQQGESFDWIAANNVTAKWDVYEKLVPGSRQRLMTPASYTWPDFLKVNNLLGVANQTAIYAIIAIGMTMVIITGGIDLGVGSLVALAAVTSALWIRGHGGDEASLATVAGGMALGVCCGAVAGIFVGMIVTRFDLPPFIVTLAIMMMANGLAFRLTGGESVSALPSSFFWLGGGRTLGLPNPIWLMLALYAVAHVVMSMCVFGRYVYAIGGNAEAARLSGVPVKRVLLVVYTVCGALAGVGGVVLASQLAAGDPKFGIMYELDVIAAVVVGGTSLMGGQGKILGTLIGAFIIAVIKNGMNLMNVESFNQRIVLGAVLLLAVLLDRLRRKGL